MKLSELVFLLLPWLTHSLEGHSYYRPARYTSIVSSPRNFRQDTPFVPLTYSSDLQPDESKRKEQPTRFSSKNNQYKTITWDHEEPSKERYASEEYSKEFNEAYTSNENDSREFTIGTQIRVQHPLTAPKKPHGVTHVKPTKSSSHGAYKTPIYSDYNFSKESHHEVPSGPPAKKRPTKYIELYEHSEPFQVVPPPKTTIPGYNVYEPEQEDSYQPQQRTKKPSYDRFKGVASKKQIEQYIEDQQKLLDEALKIKLMNDPKFKRYIHAQEQERLEHEEFDSQEGLSFAPAEYRPNFNENQNFNANNGRRRPTQAVEVKRPLKGKPQIKNKPKPLHRRFRSALVINV